jgi:hypothetical protein
MGTALPLYPIWSEGYAATGERAGAMYHGMFRGQTFKEAVEKWKATLDPGSAATVDVEKLTMWGCRLFDNPEQARKSFG